MYLDKDGKVLADARVPSEVATNYVTEYAKKKSLSAASTNAILDQLKQYGVLPGQANQGVDLL